MQYDSWEISYILINMVVADGIAPGHLQPQCWPTAICISVSVQFIEVCF